MKKIYLLITLVLFTTCTLAADKVADNAKALSGISIVGNKEAPKALYIVPWKSSDMGMETDLNSSLLNEGVHPVDKDVFLRQLDFYEVSTKH